MEESSLQPTKLNSTSIKMVQQKLIHKSRFLSFIYKIRSNLSFKVSLSSTRAVESFANLRLWFPSLTLFKIAILYAFLSSRDASSTVLSSQVISKAFSTFFTSQYTSGWNQYNPRTHSKSTFVPISCTAICVNSCRKIQ